MPPKVDNLMWDQEGPSTFSVTSEYGQKNTVIFINKVHSCSCKDYQQKHWPCQHILCVVKMIPEFSWEQLSNQFTEQEQIILDKSVNEKKKTILKKEVLVPVETTAKTVDEETLPTEKMQKECVFLLQEGINHVYQTHNSIALSKVGQYLSTMNKFLATFQL